MNKDLFQLLIMIVMLGAALTAAPYFFLKAVSDRYAKAYVKRIEKLGFRSVQWAARLTFVRLPALLLRALLRILEWLGCRTRALLARVLG